MVSPVDVVEANAKTGFRCQVEACHHAYSSRTKHEAKLYLDSLLKEILNLSERDHRVVLSQIDGVAASFDSIQRMRGQAGGWKDPHP